MLPAFPTENHNEKTAMKTATTTATTAAPKPTAAKGKSPLNVIGDTGKPVDWWFMYKISAESETTDGSSVTGGEYLYFDSTMASQKSAQLVLSPNRIDKNQGALPSTLSPLFSDAARANPNLGWYGYNDEDQIVTTINKKTGMKVHKGTGPSNRGHCKGVLAFDLASQTGFWLVHSVPLFPLKSDYAYPKSGLQMAQTYLCIALDADTTRHIAQLMFDAHGPNVNIASDLLPKSAKKPNGFSSTQLPKTKVPTTLDSDDPRLKLMQDLNGSIKKPTPYPPLDQAFLKPPYPGRVPFTSRGGQKFIAIAKNRAWGLDFYNDLVGVVLNEDLEVETWENAGKNIPKSQKQGEVHKVENMRSVNLSPLKLPYSWSEAVDHAKLALSDRTNAAGTARWVCVGDINFTDAQESRGGGTVAFQCPTLWQSLAQLLTTAEEPPRKNATKKSKSAKPDAPVTPRSNTKTVPSRTAKSTGKSLQNPPEKGTSTRKRAGLKPPRQTKK
jgi:deoxyribonuclease II